MIKKILISGVAIMFIAGCSSSSPSTSKYSVAEPTDYAMNCDSLLHEIKVIKAKLNNDDNLLEKFVPDYLLNKEDLTENDKLVLSERRKSLQLIYTLKQAKNECRALTVADSKEKSKIGKTADKVKEIVKDVSDVAN